MPEEAAGERLDRFLAAASGLSRSQIGVRVSAGDVLIGGERPSKAGTRLRAGDLIHLTVPPPPPSDAEPEDLPLAVVYEDEHIIVVDKAAAMVTHPSRGHESGTLVNALLHHFGRLAPALPDSDPSSPPRPGIVHRLDRGTSGLLVIARTVAARDGLSAQMAARDIHRTYLAIAHGPNLADEGCFDTLHGRHPRHRTRFTTHVSTGRRAVTNWRVLARARTVLLVRCQLHTGRTHQIRVHLADAGHPLVGDTLYGGRRRAPGSEGAALSRLERQALHAWRLELTHPISGESMEFEAPLPPDMARAVRAVFADAELVRLVCSNQSRKHL